MTCPVVPELKDEAVAEVLAVVGAALDEEPVLLALEEGLDLDRGGEFNFGIGIIDAF